MHSPTRYTDKSIARTTPSLTVGPQKVLRVSPSGCSSRRPLGAFFAAAWGAFWLVLALRAILEGIT